jgi:hypothetical protein
MLRSDGRESKKRRTNMNMTFAKGAMATATPKKKTAMAKLKKSMQPKNEATAIRDALPFFKKGRGKVAASWWNVTPSGNYAADLETGKAYARAFRPLLRFNCGGSDLAIIVSHMALAGRDIEKAPKAWRGIDSVALGFMMEIGGALQSALVGIAAAAVAIEKPDSELGPRFLELVESGTVLNGLGRGSLFHNPNAPILEVSAHTG